MLLNNYNPSWNDFITENIKNELERIEEKIGPTYFPDTKNVLRFLNTDLNNIKCVIVGMDPYPSFTINNKKIIPEATGRSFEVNSIRNKDWNYKFKQSSLRNILKTIYFNETGEVLSLDDIRVKIDNNDFNIAKPGDWFDNLESQGVLFLNATLTVLPGKPDSHTKIWESFMNKLVEFLSDKDIKWLLWGNKAQERILPLIDNKKTICSVHPRIASFVNENPFQYIKEINWTGNT